MFEGQMKRISLRGDDSLVARHERLEDTQEWNFFRVRWESNLLECGQR